MVIFQVKVFNRGNRGTVQNSPSSSKFKLRMSILHKEEAYKGERVCLSPALRKQFFVDGLVTEIGINHHTFLLQPNLFL